MAHFDEESGPIHSQTPWGQWWQTIDELYIEVNVPEGTSSKEIKCEIKPKYIKCAVKGQTIFEGSLWGTVIADDCLWTLEDKKLLRIMLLKAEANAKNCWKGLLATEYLVNPWTFDQMEQKLTLQRLQYENPGFNFSGAQISGNYSGGGPTFEQ